MPRNSSPVPLARERPLPAWARAADVAAATLLTVSVGLLIGGQIRMVLGPVRLSIGSVERLVAVAAGLLLLRHWRHPHPAIHRRAIEGWRAFLSNAALRSLTLHYWSIRLAIVFVGYLATASFGLPGSGPFRVSENEFLNLPARWDSGWYLGIATHGYRYIESGGQQNIAFMPAFPVLMRVAGAFAGVDNQRMRSQAKGPDAWRLLWSGLVVSLVAGWIATLVLFRLAREWLDEERAAGAALLLQAYPFSLFYGAAYTEGIFLLATVGAAFLFLRGAWGASAVLALLAGLTRPNGFILSVLLGLLWLARAARARRARPSPVPVAPAADMSAEAASPRDERAAGPATRSALTGLLAAAAAPVVSALLFSALVYAVTGHPLTWVRLHAAWGREYRSLFTLAGGYYDRMVDEGLYGYTVSAPVDALNLAAALLGLVAILPVWRRFGLPWAAYLAATLVPPLTMGGVLSVGRVTSTAFPIFLWLASALPRRLLLPIALVFMAVQGLAAALFFTWRPLF